ncbi:hypothetical protein [Proteiniphilum acetatigenes]|uniref:hypothetical protein n=1 Tax=Proteiniphilum acetatigenes TaxID=294710 RepID=UPI0003774050|nr:hypothetical protein [Proteiniphilum acetatigenes]
MITKKFLRESEKVEQIEFYKATYLSSNRRKKVDGKLITEAQFDALPLKDQWSIIYINYVRKGVRTTKDTFRVATLKNNLKTFKSKMDDLDDKDVKEIINLFTELTEYHEKKAERTYQQRLQAAEERLRAQEEAAKKASEELEKLQKEGKTINN